MSALHLMVGSGISLAVCVILLVVNFFWNGMKERFGCMVLGHIVLGLAAWVSGVVFIVSLIAFAIRHLH